MKKSTKKSKAHLFFIPAIILAVAALGGFFASGGVEWYGMIQKPSWIPPSQVFTWAVMVMYILGGYSAIVVWSSFRRDVRFKTINVLYGVTVFLFLLYTFFFFHLHSLMSAVLTAVLLEIAVVGLSVLLWSQSKRASVALFPVAVWVIFAGYMCYALWRMNELSAIVG